MKPSKTKRAVIVILLMIITASHLQSQNSFIWGKQIGTDKDEYAMNHVIDSSGNTLWARQFGSAGEEDVQWSAINNTGCIYITGSTTGVINNKIFGKEDIFIVKYNPGGEMEWSRQYGTDSIDVAKGIYADNNGFIYVTGMTV